MSPLPTPDQLAGMAVAREAHPVVRPPEVQKVVDNMNRKADEGRWHEGMAMARMGPDTGQKIAAKNEEIGTNYDPATGRKARTAQERARYNEANRWAARNEKFLRVGYDGVSPVEQDQLRADVLAEAALIPVVRDQLATMNPNQQKAFAERILREGRLSTEGKQILERLLDPENKLISDGQVFEKQDELREAELKRDNKNLEVQDLTRRVARIEQQLNQYARDATGAPTGANAVEMDRLRAAIPTLQTEIATWRGNLKTAEDALTALTQEANLSRTRGWTGRPTADILADIPGAQRDIRDAQDEINRREADMQKLQVLDQQEKTLEQERSELVKEQRDRVLERDTLDLEARKKQRELDDMNRVRTSQEVDLVNGYKNLIRESAAKTFEAELQAEAERGYEELEQLKQQTTDQTEKGLYDVLQQRWLGAARTRMRGLIGFRSRETYRPIDRRKVDVDFNTLMNQGPEQVMRNMLTGNINPATGIVYSAGEIDGLIAKKELQQEIVKQLLGRRLLSGGISPEDTHVIVNSQWGAGMVDQALAKNEEFRKAVEGELGAGGLSGPGFRERFGQAVRKSPWLLLLLVFGVAALGVKAIRTGATETDISR